MPYTLGNTGENKYKQKYGMNWRLKINKSAHPTSS